MLEFQRKVFRMLTKQDEKLNRLLNERDQVEGFELQPCSSWREIKALDEELGQEKIRKATVNKFPKKRAL